MTPKEWAQSKNAREMLWAMHQQQPEFLLSQVPQLHRFLIACCWKHQHLIPQPNLRDGLLGAEKWLDGTLSDDEFSRLDWYSEAEAFMIDYAKTPEDIAEIKKLASNIDELNEMPFSEARQLLKEAAYFAHWSMIYSRFRRLPWINLVFDSQFLCSDLLRDYIKPEF